LIKLNQFFIDKKEELDIGNRVLEKVDKFHYLGYMLTANPETISAVTCAWKRL